MDNIKTGLLIKELRKEKNMTQKELADLLHITDRAVSKWERGLCAPDISLLEPLGKALEVSILELIDGERIKDVIHIKEMEDNAKNVIDYSKKEIAHKVKTLNRKHLIIAASCAVIMVLICCFIFWLDGYCFVIDKSTSPDGNNSVVVYNNWASWRLFSKRDGVSLIITKGPDDIETRITYGNCTYQGLWWSPDSKKYVLSLKYDDEERLALAWLERSSGSNLSAYLSMGVEAAELAKYGLQYDGELSPEIKYQFLQWGVDSESMLFYYSFLDVEQEIHEGYFWYNCKKGTVTAILELQQIGSIND